MKIWTVVAAAAMGLTACQNNFEEANSVKVNNSVVVSFVAEPTKTTVDTSGETPLFSWDENETFAVLEQTDALAAASEVTYNKVDGKANIDAKFTVNEGHDEYKYVAVYPESGYVAAESINAATLALPANQTMAEASYDPNADLMVSMVVTTAAQPTEAKQMRFTRLAAVAKMTLKGLSLADDETVEKVVFVAEGKTLAGSVTTDLADPATLTAVEGSSSVTVATTSKNEVYFTVLPTTLAEGDAYGVVVVTNKYQYAKKSAIPAGKSLVFKAGMVTLFGVDMSSATASDKWVLVRDASTLEQGDVVTVAAKNYDYAVGKQGGNYPVPSQTMVVKVGDYLSHPIATEATTADNRIQHYTLMKRFADRTAFDFYNGVDYEGDTSVGFLWAIGTSYSPQILAYYNNSTLFDVTIEEEGTAIIAANDIEKTYKYWRYNHSTYTSSRKFDCTTSVPTGNYQICLYKLVGEKRTIPAVAANVTVPSSNITITEDSVTTPTAVDGVTFNYVGDWTISVSDNADWLTVSYADGAVYYTVEKNTDAKRDATVTITATKEGETDLSWSFGITQKGAPVEISIAEFMTKEKDVDSAYKLTGKITEMSMSSDGTYKITDGTNVATITYLYTDAGEEVYDKDILKVGDVVTVTTVVASSTKGKGGSSSYYSYYKGHYNLSATTTTPIIEYEGGTATIDVALNQYGTLGTIATPTAIEGTMPACDFAEFAYTTDANSATVTFQKNEAGSREVTATFKSGLAEATVKVSQKNNPAVKVGWFLVTDASELAADDKVIIVALNSNYALAVGSSTTSSTTLPSVSITKSGDEASELSTTTIFTLGAGTNEGEFSFNFSKNTTDYYYLCSNSSSDKLTIKNGSVLYHGSWTISVNASTGEATVTTVYGTTSTPTPKQMAFNSTSSKFNACTAASLEDSKYTPICLYKYYN